MSEYGDHIVFVAPCAGESFFDVVKKGAADAARAVGATWSFTGTDDVDIDEQIRIAREAVVDGATGIALSVIHDSAFDALIEDLRGDGVAVVAFNVNSSTETRLTGICQNARAAGETCGRLLGKCIAPGSKVLLTLHSQGISALDDRRDGILSQLDSFNLSVDFLVTGSVSSEAERRIAEYLDENPGTSSVIATGLADTEGAVAAVEKRGSAERRLVAGFDLSSRILESVRTGTLLFTIDQQPYLQGFYPVIQLVHSHRYGLVPSDIDTGAAVVTADNVDHVIRFCESGYR